MFNKFLESLTSDVGGLFYSKLLDALQNYRNSGNLETAVLAMFPKSPEPIAQEPSKEDFMQLCNGDFGRDTVTLVWFNDLIHRLLTGEVNQTPRSLLPQGNAVFERFSFLALAIKHLQGSVGGSQDFLIPVASYPNEPIGKEDVAYIAVASLIQAIFTSLGSEKELVFVFNGNQQVPISATLTENVLAIDSTIFDEIEDNIPNGPHDIFTTVRQLNSQTPASEKPLVPFKDSIPNLLASTIGLWQQETMPAFSAVFEDLATEEKIGYIQKYRARIIESSASFLSEAFGQAGNENAALTETRTKFVAMCNVLSTLIEKKARFVASLESIKIVLQKKESVIRHSFPEELVESLLKDLQSGQLSPSVLRLLGNTDSTIADDASKIFLKDYHAFFQKKKAVEAELQKNAKKTSDVRISLKGIFESMSQSLWEQHEENSSVRLALAKASAVFYFVFLNERIFPGVDIAKSFKRVGVQRLTNSLKKLSLKKGFAKTKELFKANQDIEQPREPLRDCLSQHIKDLLSNFQATGKYTEKLPLIDIKKTKEEVKQLSRLSTIGTEKLEKALERYPALLEADIRDPWIVRRVLDSFSALLFALSSTVRIKSDTLTNIQTFVTLATEDQKNKFLLQSQWKKIELFVAKVQETSFVRSDDIQKKLKTKLAEQLASRGKNEDEIILSLDQAPNKEREKTLSQIESDLGAVNSEIQKRVLKDRSLLKKLQTLAFFGISVFDQQSIENVQVELNTYLSKLVSSLPAEIQNSLKRQQTPLPMVALDFLIQSSSYLSTILDGAEERTSVSLDSLGFFLISGSTAKFYQALLLGFLGHSFNRKKRELQDENLFYSVLAPVGIAGSRLGNNQIGLSQLNRTASTLFKELRLEDLSPQNQTKAESNYFDLLPIVIGTFTDLSGKITPREESIKKLEALGLPSAVPIFNQLFSAYQILGNKVFDFEQTLNQNLNQLLQEGQPTLGFFEALFKAVYGFAKNTAVGVANTTIKLIGVSIAGMVVRGLLFKTLAGSLSPSAIILDLFLAEALKRSLGVGSRMLMASYEKLRTAWLGEKKVSRLGANDMIFKAILLALQLEKEIKPEALGLKFAHDLMEQKVLSLLVDLELSPIVLTDRLPEVLEEDPSKTLLSAGLLNLFAFLNREGFNLLPSGLLQQISFLSGSKRGANALISRQKLPKEATESTKLSVEAYFNFCEFLKKNKNEIQSLESLNVANLAGEIQQSTGLNLESVPQEAFRKDLLRTCLDFLVYGLALTKCNESMLGKSPWEIGLNLSSKSIVGSQIFDSALGVLETTLKCFIQLRTMQAEHQISGEAQAVFDRLQSFVSACKKLRLEVAEGEEVESFPSLNILEECYSFLEALESSGDLGKAFYFPFLLELEKNKTLLFALLTFALMQEDGFLDKEKLLRFFQDGSLVSSTGKTGNVQMLFVGPMLNAYQQIAMSPQNSDSKLLEFLGQRVPEEQGQQIVPVGQQQRPIATPAEILSGQNVSRLGPSEVWNNPRAAGFGQNQQQFPIDIPVAGMPPGSHPLAIEDAPAEIPQEQNVVPQSSQQQLPQGQQNAQADPQQMQQQPQQARPVPAYQGAIQQQDETDNSLPLVASALNQVQQLVGSPLEEAIQQPATPAVSNQNLVGVDASSGGSFGLGANSSQEIPLRRQDPGPSAPLGSPANPGRYYDPLRQSLNVAANPVNQPPIDTPFPWGTALKLSGGVLAGSYILNQLNNKKRRR